MLDGLRAIYSIYYSNIFIIVKKSSPLDAAWVVGRNDRRPPHSGSILVSDMRPLLMR